MTHYKCPKHHSILIVFLLVPLIFTTVLHPVQPSFIKHTRISNSTIDVSHTTIVAGRFFSLEIQLTSQANKITVIAYRGNVVPNESNRSNLNYYHWEYDHGVWRDRSGYTKLYIKPRKCYTHGNTYVFYISLDAKAEQGKWRIKISVDNSETRTFPTTVKPVIPLFNLGVASVKFLNNKTSLLSKLFKRTSAGEFEDKLRKLFILLKKEKTVYAAYITKKPLGKLTLPLLLDTGLSSKEMTRIKTMVFKKTHQLFPHTPVEVILLNNTSL
ncbi:MAG TPA: hypothetical protein EYP23_06390, partial [Thermoplasmata archaeon]|nr:hypothetical protein [Thermoplasmata archaeon]